MSENVQFDTDQAGMPKSAPRFTPAEMSGRPETPGMAKWLVRHGVVGADSGAKALLGGIILVNFIAAGLIIYFFVLR